MKKTEKDSSTKSVPAIMAFWQRPCRYGPWSWRSEIVMAPPLDLAILGIVSSSSKINSRGICPGKLLGLGVHRAVLVRMILVLALEKPGHLLDLALVVLKFLQARNVPTEPCEPP